MQFANFMVAIVQLVHSIATENAVYAKIKAKVLTVHSTLFQCDDDLQSHRVKISLLAWENSERPKYLPAGFDIISTLESIKANYIEVKSKSESLQRDSSSANSAPNDWNLRVRHRRPIILMRNFQQNNLCASL
jgi:hypothetical protein